MRPTEHTDQLGRTIKLLEPPTRIISCIPSTTELLHDLGLEEEVIGITKFCVHPEEWHHSKTRVGGTKNLNLEQIAELKPDLIICDKEENKQDQVEELMQHYNVWVSDANSLEEGLEMIALLGEVTSSTDQAIQLSAKITEGFKQLERSRDNGNIRKAAYLIWREPMMVAGEGTFIGDMMKRCGLVNPFPYGKNGYPEVSADMLQKVNPELVLLSSEPFPFAGKHIPEIQAILPDARVMLVDGQMFSWPGSRMGKAAVYFLQLLKSAKP
jgi:ABC-type Fe3+-hydroxamate transport system substrate-binding protein